MTRDKMMGRPSRRRNGWSAALLALSSAAATAAGGCADHVQSAVVACPCDTGVCCASGVCAADDNACTQATQALSTQSAGHWTGYVEDFTFPSGSDALDVTLRVSDDGSLSGEVIFGAHTVPAPPTDGTVGWPPDGNLFEGFVHELTDVRWSALRLQINVASGQPLGPWCRLQQSYRLAPDFDIWRCGPNVPSGRGPEGCHLDYPSGPVFVDCGWMELCVGSSGCGCTESGCDANPSETITSMDIALRGNEGDGSTSGPLPAGGTSLPRSNYNVRLIRASN
jgi:hypothetical protein